VQPAVESLVEHGVPESASTLLVDFGVLNDNLIKVYDNFLRKINKDLTTMNHASKKSKQES
jgi:hypothetical protein